MYWATERIQSDDVRNDQIEYSGLILDDLNTFMLSDYLDLRRCDHNSPVG